jgi:hypothetical protein
MKVSKLIFIIGCLLCMTSFVFAQGIVVEHWSPWELQLAGRTTPPSNGLTTVGNGEMVYLKAMPDTATSFTWSITSAPTGSAAALDSTDKVRTTFRLMLLVIIRFKWMLTVY